MRRLGGYRVAALAILWAIGCSTTHHNPGREPVCLPGQVCIPVPIENPFTEPGDCGPNALWKILNMLRPNLGAEALSPFQRPVGSEGYADFELVAMARRLGFSGEFGSLPRERLDSLLQQGTPVILLVQRDIEYLLGRGHHWIVVYGHDRRHDEYRVDWGQEELDDFLEADELLEYWARTDQRAVVVRLPQRNPSEGVRS